MTRLFNYILRFPELFLGCAPETVDTIWSELYLTLKAKWPRKDDHGDSRDLRADNQQLSPLRRQDIRYDLFGSYTVVDITN